MPPVARRQWLAAIARRLRRQSAASASPWTPAPDAWYASPSLWLDWRWRTPASSAPPPPSPPSCARAPSPAPPPAQGPRKCGARAGLAAPGTSPPTRGWALGTSWCGSGCLDHTSGPALHFLRPSSRRRSQRNSYRRRWRLRPPPPAHQLPLPQPAAKSSCAMLLASWISRLPHVAAKRKRCPLETCRTAPAQTCPIVCPQARARERPASQRRTSGACEAWTGGL
mmetsp:Transcript_13188/g.25179  ORF Transcript_13188/g.25179 Transcript_13188/m.25179 type:complete len:225 (+) Transcript_13188:1352-2026(+)